MSITPIPVYQLDKNVTFYYYGNPTGGTTSGSPRAIVRVYSGGNQVGFVNFFDTADTKMPIDTIDQQGIITMNCYLAAMQGLVQLVMDQNTSVKFTLSGDYGQLWQEDVV